MIFAELLPTANFSGYPQKVNDAAVKSGYRLFIYQTCSDLYRKTISEEGDKSVFELMDLDVTDAVVLFDEAFQDKTVLDRIAAAAESRGVPIISVGAVRQGCATARAFTTHFPSLRAQRRTATSSPLPP